MAAHLLRSAVLMRIFPPASSHFEKAFYAAAVFTLCVSVCLRCKMCFWIHQLKQSVYKWCHRDNVTQVQDTQLYRCAVEIKKQVSSYCWWSDLKERRTAHYSSFICYMCNSLFAEIYLVIERCGLRTQWSCGCCNAITGWCLVDVLFPSHYGCLQCICQLIAFKISKVCLVHALTPGGAFHVGSGSTEAIL